MMHERNLVNFQCNKMSNLKLRHELGLDIPCIYSYLYNSDVMNNQTTT